MLHNILVCWYVVGNVVGVLFSSQNFVQNVFQSIPDLISWPAMDCIVSMCGHLHVGVLNEPCYSAQGSPQDDAAPFQCNPWHVIH